MLLVNGENKKHMILKINNKLFKSIICYCIFVIIEIPRHFITGEIYISEPLAICLTVCLRSFSPSNNSIDDSSISITVQMLSSIEISGFVLFISRLVTTVIKTAAQALIISSILKTKQVLYQLE